MNSASESMPSPKSKRGFFDSVLHRAESDSKRVRFKDRGSDVSEWRGKKLTPGTDTTRLGKLDNPALAIVEDAPPDNGQIRPNPTGLKVGYNPYDSGRLAKTVWKRRRDLRRLSDWLKLVRGRIAVATSKAK
jgi:hypothetical protein